jgi:uncharacterized protein (TIGR00297 family)
MEIILLIGLGILVYKKKILDLQGTVAAVVLGTTVVYFAGLAWLFLLVLFLFLGHFSTKYKHNKKIVEKRGAKNVVANGLIPAFFAISQYFNGNHPDIPLAACYIAAVATATGDTLSSEIGILSKRNPFLITTFEKVPRGTHGAISPLGEVFGFFGTLFIGIAAWALHLAPLQIALLAAVIGGVIGFHVDSLLGAIFERTNKMSNHSVNFLSTMIGSTAGIGIVFLLGM